MYMTRKLLSFLLLALPLLAACGPKWQETEADGYRLITQRGGATLGVSSAPLIEDGGYVFKDLNRNGALDIYEDWRRPARLRAQDLAAQLSIEEIAGLMLYSAHQAVPTPDITERQKKFLEEDNLRAVLVTTVESPEVAARWNNNVQAFVEGLGHGVPANNSSDPRNEPSATAEFNMGSGGRISLWPTPLGLAATFNPALVARSICGLRAVAMPRARYSAEAICPNCFTSAGSKVAASPRGVGHWEICPPEPSLYSAVALVSLRGSEELLAGMPWPSASTKARRWSAKWPPG